MLACGNDDGWSAERAGHVGGGGVNGQDEAGFGHSLYEIGERDWRIDGDIF
jgi:hypothetical protein